MIFGSKFWSMQNTNPSVAIPITSKRNFNDPDEAIRSFRVQMELDREIDMGRNKKPKSVKAPSNIQPQESRKRNLAAHVAC